MGQAGSYIVFNDVLLLCLMESRSAIGGLFAIDLANDHKARMGSEKDLNAPSVSYKSSRVFIIYSARLSQVYYVYIDWPI